MSNEEYDKDAPNPYIEPENYFDGYQQSIDKMKSMPEIVEFDKLCHLVFNTPDGKQFIEEIKNRFLIPALCMPNNNNYATLVVYTEGYKDAFRGIINAILSHDQRIKAENTPK